MDGLPPLTEETLWAILDDKLDDDTTHRLVWHHLGYRYDSASQGWLSDGVPAGLREKFPEPPAFIDSRPATVQLTRSIPKPDKQLLKTYLGFKGYSIDQLIPRLTRRATMVSWLLSHMRQQGLITVAPELESEA